MRWICLLLLLSAGSLRANRDEDIQKVLGLLQYTGDLTKTAQDQQAIAAMGEYAVPGLVRGLNTRYYQWTALDCVEKHFIDQLWRFEPALRSLSALASDEQAVRINALLARPEMKRRPAPTPEPESETWLKELAEACADPAGVLEAGPAHPEALAVLRARGEKALAPLEAGARSPNAASYVAALEALIPDLAGAQAALSRVAQAQPAATGSAAARLAIARLAQGTASDAALWADFNGSDPLARLAALDALQKRPAAVAARELTLTAQLLAGGRGLDAAPLLAVAGPPVQAHLTDRLLKGGPEFGLLSLYFYGQPQARRDAEAYWKTLDARFKEEAAKLQSDPYHWYDERVRAMNMVQGMLQNLDYERQRQAGALEPVQAKKTKKAKKAKRQRQAGAQASEQDCADQGRDGGTGEAVYGAQRVDKGGLSFRLDQYCHPPASESDYDRSNQACFLRAEVFRDGKVLDWENGEDGRLLISRRSYSGSFLLADPKDATAAYLLDNDQLLRLQVQGDEVKPQSIFSGAQIVSDGQRFIANFNGRLQRFDPAQDAAPQSAGQLEGFLAEGTDGYEGGCFARPFPPRLCAGTIWLHGRPVNPSSLRALSAAEAMDAVHQPKLRAGLSAALNDIGSNFVRYMRLQSDAPADAPTEALKSPGIATGSFRADGNSLRFEGRPQKVGDLIVDARLHALTGLLDDKDGVLVLLDSLKIYKFAGGTPEKPRLAALWDSEGTTCGGLRRIESAP